MKTRIFSLSLIFAVCLILAVAQAVADDALYSNGPYNGTTNAWTINSGFSVSDSFTISQPSQITYIGGVFWLLPGDSLTSADISIGTTPFGSDVASYSALAPVEDVGLGTNQFGYVLRRIGWEPFPPIDGPCHIIYPCDLYLSFANANTPSGDPVYWDENSGPSTAYENELGSIPSESFTIFGTPVGTTPEPSSILLLGSGVIGLAGVLRRKLRP